MAAVAAHADADAAAAATAAAAAAVPFYHHYLSHLLCHRRPHPSVVSDVYLSGLFFAQFYRHLLTNFLSIYITNRNFFQL